MTLVAEAVAGLRSREIGERLDVGHVADDLFGTNVPFSEADRGGTLKVYLDEELVKATRDWVGVLKDHVEKQKAARGPVSDPQYDGVEARYLQLLHQTQQHIASQDGPGVGFFNTFWLAFAKKTAEFVNVKGLSKNVDVFNKLAQVNKNAVEEAAKSLRKTYAKRYNTALARHAIGNPFLYLDEEAAHKSIKDFYPHFDKDMRSKIEVAAAEHFRKSGVVKADGTIDLKKAHMVSEKIRTYLEGVNPLDLRSVVAQLRSPAVMHELLWDPEFSAHFAKLAGIGEGEYHKRRSLLRGHDEYSRAVWRQQLLKHLQDTIVLSDKPFEVVKRDGEEAREEIDLKFGPSQSIHNGRTSSAVVYDIKDSSAKALQFGPKFTKVQLKAKAVARGILQAHGGKWRNDQGDSQLFTMELPEEALRGVFKLVSEVKKVKTEASKELERDKYEVENKLQDLNLTLEKDKHELARVQAKKEGRDQSFERYQKSLEASVAQNEEEFHRLRAELENIEDVLANLPEARATLADGKYFLSKEESEPPIGEAFNQMFRLAHSWEKEVGPLKGKLKVEIRPDANGNPRLVQDGITMTKEFWKALKGVADAGRVRIVEDDETAAMSKRLDEKGLFFKHPGVDPKRAEEEEKAFGVGKPRVWKVVYSNDETIYVADRGRTDTTKNYLAEPVLQALTTGEAAEV